MEFVEVEQNVGMKEDDLCVPVFLVTMETPTLAASRESVMRTVTVVPKGPAKTTNVWIPAASHVDRVLTAVSRTMLPYADAQEEPLGTLSEAAGDSPELRFVLPVAKTLTVRLVRMTGLSAGVSQPL